MAERARNPARARTTGDINDALDELVEDGRLSARTASAYRSAVRTVLEVGVGPGWERTDVATLDVESVVEKWQARSPELSDRTRRIYASRFRVAVGFARERNARTSPPATAAEPADDGYRVPLRRGRVATISLPNDADDHDLQQIERFLGLVRHAIQLDDPT